MSQQPPSVVLISLVEGVDQHLQRPAALASPAGPFTPVDAWRFRQQRSSVSAAGTAKKRCTPSRLRRPGASGVRHPTGWHKP